MSAADLVKHQITTTARAQEVGSLGGQVRSQNKKVAAKIREMKKRGEDPDAIVSVWESADYSAFEIMVNIKGLEKWAVEKKKHYMLPGIIAMKMQYHKMIHGDASSTKIEVNIDNRTQTLMLDKFTQAYEYHHGKAKLRSADKQSRRRKRRGNNK